MDVAEQIRALILKGELVPNQRLVEADLADQFSVSRATVRNALGELAVEGLVEREQNRGARVRVISFDEAIEIAEVRRALESLCAGKAALMISDDEITELNQIGDAMAQAVACGDVGGYSAKNSELHTRIHEISGQRTALSLIERLQAKSVRQQFALAMKPGRPSVSLGEHLAIITAITRRDPGAAEDAMAAHLNSVITAMREVHAKRPSPAA
ncbi:GntR family transcriptional regulator [Mycobacterium vulneris]|nr:GntR family transcriptional regulator [Mycolicibacterium vulneris]OCB63862.1 GntR family transcriptional regulator [Mycolicibacterium vulneris]